MSPVIPKIPTGLFKKIPDSERVECTVCGDRGYPGTTNAPQSWQIPHIRGHKACPRCGNQLYVKLDGTARTHTKCPPKKPGY